MAFFRSSGVLLHPTSFPSPFGIGDLGSEAYQFVDFLATSRQSLWQILPLGTPGHGNSPYLAYSAMAGNPLLISPLQLKNFGLLSDADLAKVPEFPVDSVDFAAVEAFKQPLLEKAFAQFQASGADQQPGFTEFCKAQAHWLDDYALFMALKAEQGGQPWTEWEEPLRSRQPAALAQAKARLERAIAYQQFLQYEFFRQWEMLKQYANERGIQIIGDIPIYVAHDSADVWSNPKNFCLNPQTGQPSLMAGVPPDYFSATGQLWGNPVYAWDQLEQTQFHWWIRRFEVLLQLVDIVRIDHFRGLQAYWAVPEGEDTAINGTWIEAPGAALFEAVKAQLGQLPIIAEDLGTITPEVNALREQFDFPGMKILQFAFDSGSENPYLPFNYEGRNWVVYSGTHDNDTTVGWFAARDGGAQAHVATYLGQVSDDGIHWDLIRLASSSVANQAIFPLQDLLGLGSDARMNIPGLAENNWGWRYRHDSLDASVSDHLRQVTEYYGRDR
ncbi:MAG: 4-alpha-glucanotransferase [Synechococcales cyanobacterium RM1_1_8]|nr:4-alpha-glucanotransferase [Synechococcales cyanobacterium RM1_1_8]